MESFEELYCFYNIVFMLNIFRFKNLDVLLKNYKLYLSTNVYETFKEMR